MIDGYRLERITKSEKEEMRKKYKESGQEWPERDYWYVHKELPDGRLYSGWSFQHPTKLKAEDLPMYYVYLSNYKKHGYIRADGVVDLVYKPSPFHNHSFKDDMLYISYTKNIHPYFPDSIWEECDEYIFGSDIVDFIFAVETWSPQVDVTEIKQRMVEQYNLYCEEMISWSRFGEYKKINKLEDLRSD